MVLMVDIVSLCVAITGLIVGVLSFIKHSSCCFGAIEIETKSERVPILKPDSP